MQSLLTESFGRNKKPLPKPPKQQEDDDQNQQQSKREEDEQDDSDEPNHDTQRKKSESQASLQAMKDAFESDDSYLLITDDLRDDRFGNEIHGLNGSKNAGPAGQNGNHHIFKIKKIAKRRKDFQWKYLWVQQENAVKGSKPIWLRKWVKVKALPQNGQSLEAIPSEQNLNGTSQIKSN